MSLNGSLRALWTSDLLPKLRYFQIYSKFNFFWVILEWNTFLNVIVELYHLPQSHTVHFSAHSKRYRSFFRPINLWLEVCKVLPKLPPALLFKLTLRHKLKMTIGTMCNKLKAYRYNSETKNGDSQNSQHFSFVEVSLLITIGLISWSVE